MMISDTQLDGGIDAAAKTTALYIRVSTDAQAEEGYSIEIQKDRLAAYCVSRGWENYEYYIDGGFTGSNLDRPQMQTLIAACKERRIRCVVVFKLDRISRSQKDMMYLLEDVFLPNGVDFVSINEAFDTTTPTGRAMIGMLSVFAQLERDNIRLRTKSGMLARIQEGYWMGGGRIPFGYDYDKEQGILVPNEQAETVRKMYGMYLSGYSQQAIADALGLKYERLVSQVLKRKSNYGAIEYLGKEYAGKHRPIIDRATYDRAMRAMEERSVAPAYTDSPYLLTGMLECGVCGAKMRYQKWGKTDVKLVCYSQQKNKRYLIKDADCNNERYSAGAVERAVVQKLLQLPARAPLTQQDALDAVTLIAELQRQTQACQLKIKRLYGLYGEGGDELLRETIAEAQTELKRLQKRLSAEREHSSAIQNEADALDHLRDLPSLWPYMTMQEQRAVAREFISKVVLTHGNVKVVFRL